MRLCVYLGKLHKLCLPHFVEGGQSLIVTLGSKATGQIAVLESGWAAKSKVTVTFIMPFTRWQHYTVLTLWACVYSDLCSS